MTDGISLNQEGYESEAPTDVPPVCLFDNVKRKDTDTYLVKPSFEGDEEFQFINGLLFKKRMPEG